MILLMSKRPNCCWGVRNHFKPENDELAGMKDGITRDLKTRELIEQAEKARARWQDCEPQTTFRIVNAEDRNYDDAFKKVNDHEYYARVYGNGEVLPRSNGQAA